MTAACAWPTLASSDRVSGIINVPQGPPQFISFSPDSGRAYVSIYSNSGYSNDSDAVHLIAFVDTATGSVTSTVQVDNEKPGPRQQARTGGISTCPTTT